MVPPQSAGERTGRDCAKPSPSRDKGRHWRPLLSGSLDRSPPFVPQEAQADRARRVEWADEPGDGQEQQVEVGAAAAGSSTEPSARQPKPPAIDESIHHYAREWSVPVDPGVKPAPGGASGVC